MTKRFKLILYFSVIISMVSFLEGCRTQGNKRLKINKINSNNHQQETILPKAERESLLSKFESDEDIQGTLTERQEEIIDNIKERGNYFDLDIDHEEINDLIKKVNSSNLEPKEKNKLKIIFMGKTKRERRNFQKEKEDVSEILDDNKDSLNSNNFGHIYLLGDGFLKKTNDNESRIRILSQLDNESIGEQFLEKNIFINGLENRKNLYNYQRLAEELSVVKKEKTYWKSYRCDTSLVNELISKLKLNKDSHQNSKSSSVNKESRLEEDLEFKNHFNKDLQSNLLISAKYIFICDNIDNLRYLFSYDKSDSFEKIKQLYFVAKDIFFIKTNFDFFNSEDINNRTLSFHSENIHLIDNSRINLYGFNNRLAPSIQIYYSKNLILDTGESLENKNSRLDIVSYKKGESP